MAEPRTAPAECANCGAAIPPQARACPECGADERTGWREISPYDGLDLPDAAWSDSADEPAEPRARGESQGLAWYWWVAGLALILLLLAGALARY